MNKENYQSCFGREKGNMQCVYGQNEGYVQRGKSSDRSGLGEADGWEIEGEGRAREQKKKKKIFQRERIFQPNPKHQPK